jgi:hypothetical protein
MPQPIAHRAAVTASWVLEHDWPGFSSEPSGTLTRPIRRTAAPMARDGRFDRIVTAVEM